MYLSALTLEEKVGKLFVIPVCPSHGEQHVEKVHKLLKEKHIGGVIFMEGTSEEQTKIIQAFHTQLLTFQDAEWGVGMRLQDVASMPKNLTLGAIQDLELLRAFGGELARQCRLVGILGNFAPVVDINTNPKNPVIGNRSFGDDPQEVTRQALSVMKGMQEGGLLTCAKHFPGHGDTEVDSHIGLPKIDKSLAEIEKTELVPFQELIQSGVDLVMVGHLLFPALSRDPSSLSYEIITGLLRETLGFEGVVITDALNMRALSDHFSIEEVVTKTLFAGTDLLLTASENPEAVDFLLEYEIPRAIDHILATLPEELIEEKYHRIQALRKKMLPEIPPEDPELRRTLYRHAVTRIGEEISLACISHKPRRKVAQSVMSDWPKDFEGNVCKHCRESLFSQDDVTDGQIFPGVCEKCRLGPSIALVQNEPDPIFAQFLRTYADVECFSYEEMEKANNHSHIIVQVGPNDCPPQTFPDHAIVALFASPYKLAEMRPTAAVIGYEDVFFAKEAVADVLFGKIPALGKLPIRVYTK